ncbi:hypothetical protein GQ54DRAFT_298135 [Martensiomyces pterosporus]|nr:hypothetical protein GQ54DRAFT_298135 [Martensiomyces pterosporus]
MFRGFWGLKIVPGKTYSQTVDASFRVSNASLGATVSDEERTSVILTVDDKSFVLCSLTPGKIEQQTLDLSLTEGEEITFETQGSNEVHLTGNFIDDEDSYDSADDDEDDEDGIDLSELSPEELQEMIDEGLINPEDLLDGEDDDEDVDYDSDDAEVDGRIKEITGEDIESEEEAVPEPEPAKEVKIKKQAEKKEKKRKAEVEEPPKAKKEKKAEEKKAEEKKEKKPKSIQLPGGIVVEDKKEGTGAEAKKGKRIAMHYIGKLTNGKVFDQNTKGKPFWFRLGAGEVIKGWDLGIVGMKKGGERRLTIPAPMAYGKRGAPPDIPPNATLVFDVRLIDFK